MRIKKTTTNNAVSSSPCSSSSSSITTHSLASSTDSSSSIPSTSSCHQISPSLITRCRGLDLLVKAIHQVTAGSVVGVPYIQKRVIRRRSRRRGEALSFTNYKNMLILTELLKKDRSGGKKKDKQVAENEELLMRQRRVMALPSKYQDPVLPSWKRKSRHGREICQDWS